MPFRICVIMLGDCADGDGGGGGSDSGLRSDDVLGVFHCDSTGVGAAFDIH